MATLLQVYRSLFPDESRRKVFESAPRLPTDVFAFAGHLVERSGAYHHVSPEVPDEADGDYRRIVVDDVTRTTATFRAGLAFFLGPAGRSGLFDPRRGRMSPVSTNGTDLRL